MAYRYNASATAFSGELTRPFSEILDPQASAFLSPTGGYGSAHVDNYNFRQIVSFATGYSQVAGSDSVTDMQGVSQTVHETSASAVIENLNILDVVTADRVVARLASSSYPPSSTPEPSMLPLGSYFVNLRIAGIAIDPLLHQDLLLPATTKSTIDRICVACDHVFNETGATPAGERLRFSLFENLPQSDPPLIPGATIDPGCQISIPGFGTIVLGEYLVDGTNHRLLTMVRVVLDASEAGTFEVCAVQGNGSEY